MSLERIVTKLQEQPKEVRAQVSFTAAMVVTFVVAMVWVSTLPGRFDEGGSVAAAPDEPSYFAEVNESFFGNIKSSVANVFSATEDEPVPEAEPVRTLDLEAIRRAGFEAEQKGQTATPEASEPETILIEVAPSAAN